MPSSTFRRAWSSSCFGKGGRTELVIPRMTHETLAEMTGTTRSRVSPFMKKFKELASSTTTGARSSQLTAHGHPPRLVRLKLRVVISQVRAKTPVWRRHWLSNCGLTHQTAYGRYLPSRDFGHG
jgi:hypothetical protein